MVANVLNIFTSRWAIGRRQKNIQIFYFLSIYMNIKYHYKKERKEKLNMTRQILITSALPYANGPIHIGHLVEYIQSDIFYRFQKISGNEVFHICADDSHGTSITLKSLSENITPE